MEELARGYASVADQCGLVELVGDAARAARHARSRRRRISARCCAPSAAAPTPSPKPEAGSDVAGDPHHGDAETARGWRLDGAKLWIHNAPVCDFAVVLARTDPGAGHRGMSIFLVERDLPGFAAAPRSTRWASAPRRSARSNSMASSCRRDALLGPEEGRGFHMMMSVLDKGRIGIAALAVGILQAGARGGARLCQDAAPVRQGDRASSRACSGCSPTWPRTSTAARLLTHGAAARLDRRRARDHRLLDGQMLRQRRRGRTIPRTPCRSSAAPATSAVSRSSACIATPRSPRSTRAPTRSSATSSRGTCWRHDRRPGKIQRLPRASQVLALREVGPWTNPAPARSAFGRSSVPATIGWARTYRDFFTRVTARAIEPLLAQAEVGPGRRVLDVATGPGIVAAAAAARGATVVGVDLSPVMIALASERYPHLVFREGDAEDLPFGDATFDAVVCNFGLGHFPNATRAMAECVRVLAPAGRLAISWWNTPDVLETARRVLRSSRRGGRHGARRFTARASDLPLFGRRGTCDVVGGRRPRGHAASDLTITHVLGGPDELWQGALNSMVRLAALIRGQPEAIQDQIRAAFQRRVQPYVEHAGVRIPVSFKIASGIKAARVGSP